MLRFFFSFAFFIAFCAWMLSRETSLLLGLPIHEDLGFIVFLSALSGYNFYLLAGEYLSAQKKNIFLQSRVTQLRLLILLLSGGLLLFELSSYPELWPVYAVSLTMTIVYTLPLRFPGIFSAFKILLYVKPAWLALVWTLVTFCFPVSGLSMIPDVSLYSFFLHRFLFLMLFCLIFEKRDLLALQAATEGAFKESRNWRLYFLATFLGYMVLTSWVLPLQVEWRMAYAISGLAAGLLFLFAKPSRSYYYFYLLADGCLMLPFILFHFQRFWLTCLHN